MARHNKATGIGLQEIEENHLGGCGHSRVAVTGPPKALRVPYIETIGGPIDGPAMTLRVHKGFEQHHSYAQKLLCRSFPKRLWHREKMRDPKFA